MKTVMFTHNQGHHGLGWQQYFQLSSNVLHNWTSSQGFASGESAEYRKNSSVMKRRPKKYKPAGARAQWQVTRLNKDQLQWLVSTKRESGEANKNFDEKQKTALVESERQRRLNWPIAG
jgi:hypothetical protein